MLEADIVREYSRIEDILEGDDDSGLKSLIRKHERWLKTETIKDHHCKVVHLSCKEFCKNRNNSTPFVDLIQRELQQSREMFIIRPHPECQTPLRKSFDESKVDEITSVDSLSYMKYAPLTSVDKGFIFRRVLKDEPMKYALNKIQEKTGSDSINIGNLRKINSQTSMHDLSEDTTLYDFDFKHNWEVVSRESIQIENVGCLPSLSNPEPHYLQPSCLISPLSALSFKPDNGVAGVTSSYTYCGLPGASTAMHNEDLNFASFNQNLGNGKKGWVSSLFNHSSLMWNLLMQYNNDYPDRKDLCRAHFRKKADFIFLTQLKEWDVGFKIAIQLPGDIVVTPTGVSHQVTTVDYTFNEAINFCDNLWFKPQTNFLKLCKNVTKHNEAHGHNYDSLVKTSNFRPEFLQHKWEIWQNENISRTNFEPINYEECQMCNPSPPEPKTNDTSSKDPIAIDIPSLIVSSAGLLSHDNAGAESATLEQNNRKIPCTTKSGQHWTELAEAVVLISPLKITNYLSEGKYLIKQSRPQDLDTKLISISNVNDPPSTSTTHIEVDRRPYSGMKNAKQLVVAIESLATTGPRDSIGSNSEIDSTTTTAKTSPPPIKSLPTTKRARGRPFKIHLTAGTEETLRAIKRLPTVRKRKATGNPHWAKIKNSQISLAASQSQGITTTKRGRGRPRKGEVTAQTKKLTTIHVTKNTKKSLSALQGVRLQPTSTEGRNVQKPEIKSAAQIDSLTTSLTSSPTTTRESVGGNSETEIPTGNKLVPGTGIKSPTTHQEAPCTKANTAELPQQLVADIKSPVEQALLEVVESKSKISKLVATSQNSQVNVQPSQNKKENQIRTIREPPTTISSTPENAKPKMEKTLTILLSRIQIPIPNPAPVQNTVVPNNARRENRKARFNNKFSQFNSRLASQTSKLVEIRRKAQELSTLSSHTKAITANRSRTKAKQPQPLRITSRQFSRSPSITQISRRNRIGNTAKKATPLVTVTSSGLGTSLNNIRHNSNTNDKDSVNSSTVTELRSPSSAKNCILTPVEYANAESQTDQSLKLTQFQLLSSSSASAKAATLQDHSLHKEDERAHNFPPTVHVTPDTTQRNGTTAQAVLHFHSPAKSTSKIDLRIESPISSTNNNASQNNIDEQELANSERQKQNVRSLVNTSTSITSSANTKEITEQTEPKNPKQNYSILSTMKTRSSVVDDDEVSFLCIVQGKKPKHGAHSPTPRRTHLNSSAVTLEEAAATTTRTRKPSKLVRSRSSASNSNLAQDANGKRVPVESQRRKHKVKNPKKIVKESKNLPLPVKNPLTTAAHNTTPPRVTQATAPAPATELVSLLLQSPVPFTVQSDGLGTNQREKRQRTKKVCPCCCTTSSVKAEPEIDPGTVHNFSEAEQLASPSPAAAATTVSRSAQEIHSAILRALCHICGKSFSNIDALHSHLQSKHADWREMEGNRHERNIPGHNSEFSSLENDVKRCSPNKKSDLNVTLPSHRQFRNRVKRRRKGKKKTDKTRRKEKSKKLRHKELLSSYEEPATTHPFCEKSFDSKYHVSDTHPHTEIPPPIMEFHCECGKAYKHRSDLLRHIRHGKSRSTFKCVESSNTSRRGKHASRSPRRRKIDPKMEELTVRMAKVGFLEEDDDASLDQSSSSQPKERGENSQRTRLEELLYPIVRPTCNLCQKSFMNKYVRDAHVHVTHSTVKKFQCICGLKYKNRSDLRRHQKHQRLKEINDSGYNSDCWKKSKAPHSSHRSVQTLNLTFRNELKRKASIGELVEGAVYDSVPNSGDHQPTPNSNLNTISNHVIKTQTQAKSTAPRCKTKKRKTRRTSARKSSAPLPRHMCHLCENSFKDKNRLDYHVKFTHSSVKRFKCECGKAYKHASDLRRHQKESELYACQSDSDDQEPSPTNSNLNTTLNIAIETQTKDTQLTATCSKIKNSLEEEESVSPLARPTCHLCGKSFKNKIVLRSHLKFTHSKIRQFQCHCGKTYKSPSDLTRHRKKQRSKIVNDAGYNSDCLKFSVVPSSRHLLRTLQTLTSTLEESKRETSNGDLVEDTVCDSAPTPSSSSSHVNGTHSQVKFQCNCGKIYKSRSGLQRHRKKQRSKTVNDKGYNLDCMRSCNVPRNTRPKTKIQNGNTRRTSLQEILGKLKRSTCHLCEKSFKSKYALDCHVKLTHSPNVNVEKVTKTGQT